MSKRLSRAQPMSILALDGAGGHVHQLLENPDLDGIVEQVVVEDGAGDEREREVACVDGKALAHGDVHAGLAAAQLRLVCDVVVDERRGVEVLDRSTRAQGEALVPTYRLAGEQRDQGAMALAPVVGIRCEGLVEVATHVWMGALAEIRAEVLVDLCRALFQVLFEDDVSHSPCMIAQGTAAGRPLLVFFLMCL